MVKNGAQIGLFFVPDVINRTMDEVIIKYFITY